MEYEHHIFVSYAHGELWTPWVRETFVPKLRSYLQLEAGRLEVFVDDQIQTGARWDAVLKRKVARSKLMVSLLSADYFQRQWCRREMALMLEREELLGLIGHDDNYGLLIPVRLGDGLCFPDVIGLVQHQEFDEFADPDLPPASTLPQVPADCDSWQHFTGDTFLVRLEPKPLPKPTPPRLIV